MAKIGGLLNLIIVYVAMNILVYLISDVLIFCPPKSSYSDQNSDIIKLTTANDKKISAKFLYNPKAEFTILYSHGNACDIGYISSYIKRYYDHGYSILVYDYQGYGTSDGKASKSNTYKDIKAAYDFLIKEKSIDPNKIILVGNSVGSGPTIELAVNEKVGGVVLESSFYSAFRVITKVPLFFVDKYKNGKKLPKLAVPVLIIHGDKDKTIGLWHSDKLYKVAREPKKLVKVKGAGHNDMYDVMGDAYWKELVEFTKEVMLHKIKT